MKNIYTISALLAAIFTLASAASTPYEETRQNPPENPRACWVELRSDMLKMHEAMNGVAGSADCDENFVLLMLPHHQAALDMAKTELLHGKDPFLRRLAQEIITDQQSEIDLMQRWLQQRKNQKGTKRNHGGH